MKLKHTIFAGVLAQTVLAGHVAYAQLSVKHIQTEKSPCGRATRSTSAASSPAR